MQIPSVPQLFGFYTSLVTLLGFFTRYVLPPSEKFDDWPRFQGYYKLFMVIINWIAFNRNGGTNGSTTAVQTPTPSITAGK